MEPLDYATGDRRNVTRPDVPRPYTPIYEPGPIMRCLGWILYITLELLGGFL